MVCGNGPGKCRVTPLINTNSNPCNTRQVPTARRYCQNMPLTTNLPKEG